jgi:hypothetical protein
MAKETPAAPISGKAVFLRFRLEVRFACAIVYLHVENAPGPN